MVDEVNASCIRLDPLIELFSALQFGDIQVHRNGGKQSYLLRVVHCLTVKVEYVLLERRAIKQCNPLL